MSEESPRDVQASQILLLSDGEKTVLSQLTGIRGTLKALRLDLCSVGGSYFLDLPSDLTHLIPNGTVDHLAESLRRIFNIVCTPIASTCYVSSQSAQVR